jgi:hypothetical protein
VWRCGRVALCGVWRVVCELMTQVFPTAAAQARHTQGPVPLLHRASGVPRGLIRHALWRDSRFVLSHSSESSTFVCVRC